MESHYQNNWKSIIKAPAKKLSHKWKSPMRTTRSPDKVKGWQWLTMSCALRPARVGSGIVINQLAAQLGHQTIHLTAPFSSLSLHLGGRKQVLQHPLHLHLQHTDDSWSHLTVHFTDTGQHSTGTAVNLPLLPADDSWSHLTGHLPDTGQHSTGTVVNLPLLPAAHRWQLITPNRAFHWHRSAFNGHSS